VPAEDNQARNAEICRLADEGISRADLAQRFNVTKTRITQIVTRGREQETSERERELRKLYQRQGRRADNVPPKGTATGFNQLDLRTCTCGSLSERIKDHDPACKVKPVLDERIGMDADKERRLLLKEMRAESDRKDVLSDAESQALIREMVTYLDQVVQRNKYLERQLARYQGEADVMDAEIVPDVSPDALPALEAARDSYAGQF
jgi:CENP-B N-terminal DNA-binding domain